MAKDVANAFVNNAKVKSVLDVRAYDLAVIKPRELPNGLTYIGTIHKLGLDLYQYNEWYLDNWTDPSAPTQKPLVPDGHACPAVYRSGVFHLLRRNHHDSRRGKDVCYRGGRPRAADVG